MQTGAERVGLPTRSFFYTADQIATILSVTDEYVRTKLYFYEGRSVGVCPKDRLLAVNIAPAGIKPEWRVLERHFIRWLRFKGYKYHERGYVD